MEPSGHTMLVCSRCRGSRSGSSDFEALSRQVRDGLDRLDFRLEAVDCMAGCERPVAVAFRAAGKATYLFGNIDAERDGAALAEFAKLYRVLGDGWCNEGRRPAGLRGKTVARIPAGVVLQ